MVAAAGVSRLAWPAAAGVAAALLAALAFHGERPQSGLARFAPAGVLADWPVGQVTDIGIVAGPSRRAFHRGEDGWRSEAADAPGAALGERIERGLTLLRNSPPQRVLEASEVADRPLGEFGLAPPGLVVTATAASGAHIMIEFGGANPLGLARYARVAGRPEVLLLSSYVAEAWEGVAAAR